MTGTIELVMTMGMKRLGAAASGLSRRGLHSGWWQPSSNLSAATVLSSQYRNMVPLGLHEFIIRVYTEVSTCKAKRNEVTHKIQSSASGRPWNRHAPVATRGLLRARDHEQRPRVATCAQVVTHGGLARTARPPPPPPAGVTTAASCARASTASSALRRAKPMSSSHGAHAGSAASIVAAASAGRAASNCATPTRHQQQPRRGSNDHRRSIGADAERGDGRARRLGGERQQRLRRPPMPSPPPLG